MVHQSIDGVVVRVRDMKDHDRYLSVLTAERGRITLLSKGSRSMRGEQMAISQLYAYGNFEYYSKGGIRILKGGTTLQNFYALSMDIDRLNLAAYLDGKEPLAVTPESVLRCFRVLEAAKRSSETGEAVLF